MLQNSEINYSVKYIYLRMVLEVGRGGELGFSVKHQYFLHKSQNEMIVECIVQYVGTGKIL